MKLVQSQTTQGNKMGWYHLLAGAQTRVLDNCVGNNKSDVYYATDEILLIFDFKGSTGYAVDIDGRIVEITDISKTKRIDTAGRVVKMVRNIDVTLNKRLTVDNNVWLVGFNPSSNSAKVLLGSGEIVEIPKDSYIELRDYFLAKNKGKYKTYPVEDH
jgi:hypothetical protein